MFEVGGRGVFNRHDHAWSCAASALLVTTPIPHEKELQMDSNMDQTKGKIKEAVGDLTENADLKKEGKADQQAGKAKELVEDAGDKAKSLIDKVRGSFSKK